MNKLIYKLAGALGAAACVLKNVGTLAKAGYQHGYETAKQTVEKENDKCPS